MLLSCKLSSTGLESSDLKVPKVLTDQEQSMWKILFVPHVKMILVKGDYSKYCGKLLGLHKGNMHSHICYALTSKL